MSARPNTDTAFAAMPPNVRDALDALRNLVAPPVENTEAMFQLGAAAVFRTVAKTDPHFSHAIDAIDSIGEQAGLYDADLRQKLIDGGFEDAKNTAPPAYEDDPIIRAWERNDPRNKRPANGHDAEPAPEPEAYGTITAAPQLPATIDDTSAIVPAKFITPAAWPNEAPPPVDWLVTGFIQRGDVTTLHGDGGAGKTDIALRLAANVERGFSEWLGLELTPTANGPVVFISAEDPERKVRRRLWHHAKHDGYDLNAVTNLHLWFPAKMSGTVLAVPDRYTGTMKPTAAFQSLAAAIVDLRPVLVITDNVAATYGGNQNDRAQVRSFVNLWADIAEGPSRPAVLLLDHPSLSGLTNGTGRGGNMVGAVAWPLT
jgi:hypothetical protein